VEWVLKEQGLAAEGMSAGNDYMYGENLPVSPVGLVDTGLGQAIEGGEVTFIEPTDIIGKQGGSLTIDGVEIDFMFALGEAPTGMHCYFPRFKTLHVADNCYMCLHNVYTIPGAFPRDAMQWAEPDNEEARALAASAHTQLGCGAENATWRNAYLPAAQELCDGVPTGAKNHRALRDVMKGMRAVLLLNSIAIRLNGPNSIGRAFIVNWKLGDSGENCHTELTNCVLVNREGLYQDANVSVELPRAVLSGLALGESGAEELKKDAVRITGDAALVFDLLKMLDDFPPWFTIATHGLKHGEV
jgi:alkyl sulfatase BDS1-like metallo-beta-lactamase superfamily hydrolase